MSCEPKIFSAHPKKITDDSIITLDNCEVSYENATPIEKYMKQAKQLFASEPEV